MNPYLKLAYQPYKWIVAIPLLFITTMVMAVVCVFTGLLMRQDAANHIAVLWARICCKIVPLSVVVHGKKNYNKNQSYVVVANHQSMADIPVIHAHLGLNVKWIMKTELAKIPIFGYACHQLGCIYVDRSNHAAAIKSIEAAKKRLSKKASVFFFAEGTRSRDGRVMPFKKGAFRFALETGLPILPVTIRNSFEILPSDTLDLVPGTVEVIVHRPIHFRDHHTEHLETMVEQTRQVIADAL